MNKGMKAGQGQAPTRPRQEGLVFKKDSGLLLTSLAAQGRVARRGGGPPVVLGMVHSVGTPLLRGTGSGHLLRQAMHGAGTVAGETPGEGRYDREMRKKEDRHQGKRPLCPSGASPSRAFQWKVPKKSQGGHNLQ